MTLAINEFFFDNSGADIYEFIELKGDPNTDYTGYTVVYVEGDNGSTLGRVNVAVELGTDASAVTDANGILNIVFTPGALQNGTGTIMLVNGPVTEAYADVDQDGTLDVAWDIVDSVAVDEGGSDVVYSPTVVDARGGASVDPDTGEWVENDYAGVGLPGSGAPGPVANDDVASTPGAPNDSPVGEEEEPPFEPAPPEDLTAIYDIQGEGHSSAFTGLDVISVGIVTAVDSNGFYFQDAAGDGNARTSDGVFVYTGSSPEVVIGDEVQVTGNVGEYQPGGGDNLTITQIYASGADQRVDVISSGNPLPAAVILTPPTEIINDDTLADYDPETDGLDYFESVEGMLVTVEDAVATSPSNQYGEVFVVGNNGDDATGPVTDNGGLLLSEGDPNPERIQIDPDFGVTGTSSLPDINVGDELGDITGVVSYSFGNYEVQPTSPVVIELASGIEKEITTIADTKDDDQLTVASYNMENLDPSDGSKFAEIADQIVNALNSPDIIAAQEIQDNSGSTNDGTVSASETYAVLIQAIIDAGGPAYEYIDLPPEDGQDGGQPGGNIRVGYLYDPSQVSLVEGSETRIEDPAYDGSRKPVAATFEYNGEQVEIVNVHFSSKGGDDGLYEANQPPALGSEPARIAQAQAVNDYVDAALADNPDAKVMVIGDMNDFTWSAPLETLAGGTGDDAILSDLALLLDVAEQYGYNYQGNAQLLDHLYATDNLRDVAEFDIVNANSEFADQVSDHDPLVSAFYIPEAEDMHLSGGSGAQDLHGASGDDTIHGGSGNDTLSGHAGDDRMGGGSGHDILDGANGDDTLNGGSGHDTLNGGNDDDLIRGGSGHDNLQGGAGDDTLRAGSGHDTLNGGEGDDVMRGGSGSDLYIFDENSGFDVIRDLSEKSDVLDLSALGFETVEEVIAASVDDGRHSTIFFDESGDNALTLNRVSFDDLDELNYILSTPAVPDVS